MNEASGDISTSNGYRYPLELVATIAAILKGCESVGETLKKPPEPVKRGRNSLDPNNLSNTVGGVHPPNPDTIAAHKAVSLLYACERRLQQDDFFAAFADSIARDQKAEEDTEAQRRAEVLQLTQKFPEGCSFKKGIIYITGKKSEADAVKPYRQWLQYLEILREQLISDEAAISLIALDSAKKGQNYNLAGVEDGARIMASAIRQVEERCKKLRAAGFAPYQLHKEKEAFQTWYAKNKISLARKQGGFGKAKQIREKRKYPS